MNTAVKEPADATRATIVKSVAGAAICAALITVAVVLPAEYGVDLIGVGRLTGLSALSKAKTQPAATPAQAAAQPATDASQAVMHAHAERFRSDRIEIPLQGDEELEYKALLPKGESMLYSWTVKGGPVYVEFHGEPTEGKWPEGFYQSYEKVDGVGAAHGSFVAPFTGNHGWYWLNLSAEPATITLEVTGYYSSLGRVGEAPKEKT